MTPQDLKAARDRGRRDFTWADLRGLDLRGIDLAGANLSRGRMEGVVAQEVNFAQAILGRASLRGADLRRSHLGQAVLVRADLSQACLEGANLQQADLSGAIAEGASWQGADLTGAKISWPWPSADLAGATMPDGRPYSPDWQPPEPDPEPEPDAEELDPFGELGDELGDGLGDGLGDPSLPTAALKAKSTAEAHADLAQHLSQATVPKPKLTRADLALQGLRHGRRNRFLTADPDFAVPGVGPAAPPPPPRSLTDWAQRLERSLVIFTLLGYLLLGMALVGREADWRLWVIGAIGCWAGLLGEGWLIMGPGMGAIAFGLSMVSPVREFICLMALLVGTSFLTWSLVFGHGGQSRGRKRQALNNGVSVASGVAGLISILFALTTTPLAAVAAGAAIVCLLLGLPLGPVMADRGLTKLQQAMTLLVLAGVGLAIAQLVG